MDLSLWRAEYRRICEELGIVPKYDYDARDIISDLVKDKSPAIGKLEALIKGRDIVVFGAGPSLEQGVEGLEKKNKVLIASDGSTSCLLEHGIYPDIVVTDLDGKLEDLLLANRFGAIIVVHAHGDNISKIKEIVPRLKKIIATTQVEPLENVYNFFGFTDGDRAVFIAKHFGARNIELIGFDFGEIVGKYSNPQKPIKHVADEKKKKKLEIAKRLIERN